MIKYISKKEITNLLSKINIVNIIGSFISLTKKNNGFFSICPFHEEKTPSFFINENKQKFYCFGCHKSGNIITFLMDYKKISFIESINVLTNKTNIKITDDKQNLNYNIYKLMDKVALIYQNNLHNKNTDVYKFLKNRNLKKDILNKFQIGFAENSWNFILKTFGISKNIKNDLITIGLLIKKNKYIYDRFRNRIIFPIRNVYGKTLGFGGRILNNQDQPKYINSPESIIFSKRQELYGLYESRLNNIKENYVIIVEGYLDVITLHNNNVTNVVGILGTSFTKDHFKKLKKTYDKLIFCFDGDTAGKRASIRTAYICLSYMDFKTFIGFTLLPEKTDPDSYINTYGKEKFLYLINKSIYILDYIYKNINVDLKLNTIHNKLFLANNIQILIKKITNPLIKKTISNHFIKKMQKDDIIKKDNLTNSFNLLKKHKKSLSLGMQACALLLKKRNLFHIIDLEKLMSNKNIKFKSDLNTFLELVILLRKNINVNFKHLHKRMLGDINIINSNFFLMLNDIPENILLDEFIILLNKIYKIKNN